MLKKEDLRPPEFKDESHGKKYKGWFHCWIRRTYEDGGQHVVGLMEDEEGNMYHSYDYNVKFLDRMAVK